MRTWNLPLAAITCSSINGLLLMTKRFVLDTNTVISGIFWPDSFPGQAINKALRHQVLISPEIEREFLEVLARPKFDKLKHASERFAALESFLSKCQKLKDAGGMGILEQLHQLVEKHFEGGMLITGSTGKILLREGFSPFNDFEKRKFDQTWQILQCY
jgi:hypothetical protein